MYFNPVNNCNFVGRLVKDVEYSQINTQKGPMGKARFTLAVQRGKDASDFINFDAIGPEADFINKFFKKGSGMAVSACYKNNNYTKDGKTVYNNILEVVKASFIPSSSNNGGNNSNGGYQNNQTQDNFGFDNGMAFIPDGDIPF